MPTYAEWNEAIVDYFTRGAPLGSAIYLEVTDRNLDLIGRQNWGAAPEGGWPADYFEAVRAPLSPRDPEFLQAFVRSKRSSIPPGVAFLGVLVWAATQMDRDEAQNISDKNYYVHLHRVLRTEPTNDQVQRPKFMQIGRTSEEPLWLDWAAYLRERGYLPTAVGGSGAWKYIRYAVSQTLLRGTEKRQLFRLFEERRWGAEMDGDRLVGELRRSDRLPVHLLAMLRRTGQAAEDVRYALEEAFGEWLEGGSIAVSPGSSAATISAGLHRTEHRRTGDASYALYPRQPRGRRWGTPRVAFAGGEESLAPDRPGYFAPVGAVTGDMLAQGARWPVVGDAGIAAFDLPRRPFWVLRADPDVPGVYASLGRPQVGEHLLILVQDGWKRHVERLRELGLLLWAGEEKWEGGWTEFVDAMVIATHWKDAQEVPVELRDALVPSSGVSLSVTGGLSIPRAGIWLADAPPLVRVNSLVQDVSITLLKDGEEIWSGSVDPDAEAGVALPWDGPGAYEIDVVGRGQGQRRIVNLVDWDQLPPPNPESLGTVTSPMADARWLGPTFEGEGR